MEDTPNNLQPPKLPEPPGSLFFATLIFIFIAILVVVSTADFIPNYLDRSGVPNSTISVAEPAPSRDVVPLSNLPQLGEESVSSQAIQEVSAVLPKRIEIPAIKMDLSIQNPSTRDVEKLYNLLVSGPARYVDSAKLGEVGNMIVFGHSSRLPVVRNRMYKAFNDISELDAGDAITVTGENGDKYLYLVTTVRTADAEEDVISLSKDSTRLTLVTCNVLKEKTSRFIVEADFIGVLPA